MSTGTQGACRRARLECQRQCFCAGVVVAVNFRHDRKTHPLRYGRIELIKRKLLDRSTEYDRGKLQERLAKLTGGIAVIKVGAASEVELKERKDLVDDAIHATQAATQEGVVPGGGVALLRCQAALDELGVGPEHAAGVQILRRALEVPLRRIVENAGVDGSVVVQRVREGREGYGYDAASERYEDLLATGVIDPTKVVRVALENAVSVAGLLLTTEAVVVENDAKDNSQRRAPRATTTVPHPC